jgi:hypothetical protein
MLLRLSANSSLRDRIERLTKTDFGKVEVRIIKFSVFLFSVVVAGNLLTYRVGPMQNTGLRPLKSLLLIMLAGMVGMIVLLTSIAYLIIAVRDRDKEVARLKLRFKEAYSKAFDQSSFNPHLVERKHEQSRPGTRQ